MKGWYGKREQHSLASKGIKSKVKQYKAMGKYNYYEQLEDVVLNHVESYQTDFTKHDKATFDDGVNEFILGIRNYGTHMFKIDFNENTTPEGRLASIGRLDYNDKFFYGKDGEVTEVSIDEAREILEKRIPETESERKHPITDFNTVENYEVFEDAVKEIDQRQHYGIREEEVIPKKRYTHGYWSNGSAEWVFNEQIYHDNTVKLDANEIVLPYKLEQVLGVSYALQPLPLFGFSHEAKQMFGAEEQDNITIQWGLKQLESKSVDNLATEKERMEAIVMLAKLKNEFGDLQKKDKRSEWL